MNLAFYVQDTSENDLNNNIYECLNEGVNNKHVSDASIFYNNPAYNGKKTSFGMFNATDIWAYTGILISTTLQNTDYANKIVNKFKLHYLYSKGEKNLFGLIDISNQIPVCVSNEEDGKEFYRLTGKKPKMINFKAKDILELLS